MDSGIHFKPEGEAKIAQFPVSGQQKSKLSIKPGVLNFTHEVVAP
jgi:hypothetical protein